MAQTWEHWSRETGRLSTSQWLQNISPTSAVSRHLSVIELQSFTKGSKSSSWRLEHRIMVIRAGKYLQYIPCCINIWIYTQTWISWWIWENLPTWVQDISGWMFTNNSTSEVRSGAFTGTNVIIMNFQVDRFKSLLSKIWFLDIPGLIISCTRTKSHQVHVCFLAGSS